MGIIKMAALGALGYFGYKQYEKAKEDGTLDKYMNNGGTGASPTKTLDRSVTGKAAADTTGAAPGKTGSIAGTTAKPN